MERTILPRPHLQLPSIHHLLHIDTCFGKPSEVLYPPLGVNQVVTFFSPVESILDERAKHPIVLVEAVEERTNMTLLPKSTLGKLRGLRGDLHILNLHAERAAFSPGGAF